MHHTTTKATRFFLAAATAGCAILILGYRYIDPEPAHWVSAGAIIALLFSGALGIIAYRRLLRRFAISEMMRDLVVSALPIRLAITNRAGDVLFDSHPQKGVNRLRDALDSDDLKLILDLVDLALSRPGHWHTNPFLSKKSAKSYIVMCKRIGAGTDLFGCDAAMLVFSDITEATQTKATLSAVLNAVGDAVIATDGEGSVTLLNSSAEFLTGYSSAEAIGRHAREICYPMRINGGTEETNSALLNAALKENRIVRAYGDAELIPRDGCRRTVSECLAPIRNTKGDSVGAIIVMRDITADRLNEQNLLQTCQRLNEASHWAKMSYFSVLPSGETLSIAGYPLPFAHGKTIDDWLLLIPDPEERQELQKTFALAFRGTTERLTRRFTLIDLNGTSRTFELLLSSILDPEDRITCMGTLQDVSERHNLARNYLEANTLLNALLDDMPSAVLMKKLVTGGEGTYCIWNKRAEKYFKITSEDAIGRTARQIPVFTNILTGIENEEATFTPDHPELRYNTTVGEKTYTLIKKAIQVEGDRYILIIANNITDFITNEQRLREAVEAAKAAEKDKSFFLATMSHELRTPLNAVIGFSELLQSEDGIAPADQAHTLRSIHFAATTLLALINNILDFSKIEAGRFTLTPEPVNLKPFLVDIVSLFRQRAANENITLTVNDAPNLPTGLLIDRQALRQILINIINNAIKFTREGEVYCESRWAPENGTLTLIVKDSGIGISKENLERIFKPFEQLKTPGTRSIEGTGLGLVISHRLALLMGGGITVESEGEGKGSRFTITISNLTTTAPVKESITSTSLALPESIRNRRLFILDDVPLNLHVLGAMLKRLGVAHTPFSTADAAFKAIASGECPDAILTDLWMPDCSGIELVQRLHTHCPGSVPPVVIVTADTQYRPDPKAGIADALYKPITLNDLHALLQNLFAEEE